MLHQSSIPTFRASLLCRGQIPILLLLSKEYTLSEMLSRLDVKNTAK